MFIIMSVFSGFRYFYLNEIFQYNPDFQIESKNKKIIFESKKICEKIKKHPNVKFVSRVIEEKIYLVYQKKHRIVTLRAVDENYIKIIPFHSIIYDSNDLNIINDNSSLISLDLFYDLNFSFKLNSILLYIPKRVKKIINNQNLWINCELYVKGLINNNFSNTIITSIKNAEYLLEYYNSPSYFIIVKVNNNTNNIQLDLQKIIGKEFIVKNKLEQNNIYFKINKIEKFFTYLVFVFINLFAFFNLAIGIMLLIINKKKDNQIFYWMGLCKSKIKKIYFFIGLIITFFSSILGIVIGLLIIMIHHKFSLFKIKGIKYPIEIEFFNIFLVLLTFLISGFLFSWISTRKLYIK